MYLLLRILAMSSKDIDVGLPDVGPSGLGLDEVVPGGVQVGTRLGMTTRSMARGVDNDGIIDPEDSVSNLGSRASCTSVLSEAQIEIQWQMETNRIMADLRLAKLAREEKQAQLAQEERQAQLAREERQAQLAREEKEAELKAELALKEAALKAEFLKKDLECRKSRSGSQVSSRRSAHTRTDFLETHGGYLNTNSQQSKAVISGGGGETGDVLLPKTAVRENLTLQKFSDSNNLLGSNDRSLRGNVAFGAAQSVPPDFEKYVVSPGVSSGRAETCPKICGQYGKSAVEYDGGVKNKYVSAALPAVTNARSCNVGGLNWNNGLSPVQSGLTQQDSFFQYQNCRTFIDKASLINYNGSNMPYIFFHNRIKALMDSCPFENSRLTLLQAACVGLAGQNISNLVADTPGLSEARRIEMSLERLSQRFGVRGGFYAEPEIRKFRYGDKLKSDSAFALKEYKDQLSQCLLYAKAYNQPDKVEGRFVLDLAKRLPDVTKKEFLKFLANRFGHTNEPSFESLFEFITEEESYKSTDFGISLLNASSELRKFEKPHDKSKKACPVRQTSVKSPNLPRRSDINDKQKKSPTTNSRPEHPMCIYCSSKGLVEHHYLSNCSEFLHLTPIDRKDVIVKSGRCFNCLRKHFVKDCFAPNSCGKCGAAYSRKHSFLLHDAFVTPSQAHESGDNTSEPSVTVRKVGIGSVKAASSRVTAARIMNPVNGKSRLVYVQHDPGSQVTLVSNKLVQDLGLTAFDNVSFEMQTMTSCKATTADLVKFNVQSLHTGEIFGNVVSVVNEPWSDDENILPHKQDLSVYEHFNDIEIVCLDNCHSVDVLLGNDNAHLMYAKQERMGKSQTDPHALLSPLGWLAFGGKTSLSEVPVKVLRANVEDKQSKTLSLQQAIDRKDAEIAELRSVVKDLSVEDEIPQWSCTDTIASQLVEPSIKVKDDRFEIPVPVVEKATLLNNFELAHERLSALHKKALRQPHLKEFLVESMAEMQSNNYIERVPDADCANDQKWYLPYFVTSQVKKRIVYDGKAKFKGTCVNDIIMSGPDLLNPLLHVLTRFRLGKYALMSDVTKCFFQIQLPAAQRDLFRLLWFENNDVERGKLVSYRFRVHPWGIKSSPYIACLAFKKLVEENPTCASDMTLQNILQNMYMDDLIFSVDSLESAQTITNEAVSLFKSCGFKLVKWSANRDTMSVLSSLGPELLSASIRELDLCGEELALPSAKTLGCVWDPDSDELRIDCSLKPLGKYTCRTMLSQLGQNFDPLGFGSPFFIKAHLILQQLAIDKYDWDTKVPDEIDKEWDAWLHSLSLLQSFLLPRFTDLRGPLSTIYSDNGTTFQAAAKVLPKLLESTELKNSLCKGIDWEFIPPYAPAQGGAWEAMVKQIKHVIDNTLEKSQRRPSFVELLTYVGSATKIVNDRPLTPLSDDPRDFTAITPALLLTPYSSPYCVVGSPQHKDNLRRDYRFNISLSDQFWQKWLEFYLPWQQGRKKWLKMVQNLMPGQLVILTSMEDVSKRGKYQLGRVHEVIPQNRNGKQIVRRVKVATTSTDESTGDVKVVYVLRDLSCIAPVDCPLDS